jgi:hypothetical protein
MREEKVIKTAGHCYDGCGWTECSFWVHGEDGSCCKLFGGAEKYASEALIVCNKIYGTNYEGKP